MKTLIIAEKPDMGRNIAAAIEPKAMNKRSYLEGEQYIITWAIGHLITLAEPDKYDDKYKKWSFHDLPIIPDTFKLIPYYKTKDQLKLIGELAKRCNQLVNACDAGREGQHIFALIQQHLNLKQPVKRLWISDLTEETIRLGFKHLKDGAEYDNLTKAAKSRSEADWLIGMNGSRAFTTKHNVLLSIGRVQTPVLALILDRQVLIENFSKMTYYVVEASFVQGEMAYKGIWQGVQMTDKQQAENIVSQVKGKLGAIESYEAKDTKEFPFKLYDLTLLQREANAKFGFSAKKTLDTAQALYEKHKVISYPRTNSNYVTVANIAEMHRALDNLQGTDYDRYVQAANKRLVHKDNKYICNPAKVEDHHAILPTLKKPNKLSSDEHKIYDLIVRRFLSHYYPPAQYTIHTVITLVGEQRFKTTVKQLLDLGWKVIYDDPTQAKDKVKRKEGGQDADEREEEEITDVAFSLDRKQGVICSEAIAKEKDTQPPKSYTEGTLLRAMESAGRQIEDEELRDAMKDSGLGTPATRASTIERLKKVEYIEMQGKTIRITQKGRTVVELIRAAGIELLTSPEMTGHWERRLNEISKGKASDTTFMENVKKFTRLIVDKVGAQPKADKKAFENIHAKAKKPTSAKTTTTSADSAATAAIADKKTVTTCPRTGCGGTIFMGKKGYGCSKYKDGCTFVIWKQSFGKTLTDPMVRRLVEKGKTNKLKLKSEAGHAYEAFIILKDTNTGGLGLEFVTE